jgi:hypothetical protein
MGGLGLASLRGPERHDGVCLPAGVGMSRVG